MFVKNLIRRETDFFFYPLCRTLLYGFSDKNYGEKCHRWVSADTISPDRLGERCPNPASLTGPFLVSSPQSYACRRATRCKNYFPLSVNVPFDSYPTALSNPVSSLYVMFVVPYMSSYKYIIIVPW